ncbi:uncharacterized protein N7506_000743 [Penicillium brevicompactum]|uniref:uncharacterized protein n=1 Tax=Penicillium brevicompactum TaxID=5074 RepID=UPI0025423EE9|nr:uncharacterized protein N7506_000743 [Penicillium brevicompactum]KAJ5347490.1 hypothetical protein N7506_000743 [Penicillium brevicompactum]
MTATVHLLLAEHLRTSRLRSRPSSNLAFPFPKPQHWANTTSRLFATLPRRHFYSSMASESFNSSQEDVRGQQRADSNSSDSSQGKPYATRAAAAAAEHKVLSYLPYLHHHAPTHLQTGTTTDFPNGRTPSSLETADHTQLGEVATSSSDDPYGPRRWTSSMVELNGKDRALNEFSVERIGEEADQHLVMLHGYGAGLGFFYKNFEPLSRLKGWQLHALDMLGMGRSTRPSFKIKAKGREDAIREAEAWFVDALEEWRIKRKIDRFTLLGHSLGGYMAVAYALKYPGHLNKLILASPVGIPEDPYAVTAEVTEPSSSTLPNELTQDQRDITSVPETAPKTSDGSFITGRQPPVEANQPPRRVLPKWFAYLWEANISPFSLVRWAGPLGPRIVSGWTSRRFSHLPAEEASALHDYSYSIFSLRGSGEYALAYILAPGAFARSPLIHRVQGLGRQLIHNNSPLPHPMAGATAPPTSDAPDSTAPSSPQPTRRENGLPVVFMYGDHDWMDVSGGHAAAARLQAEKEKVLADASPEERRADEGSSRVVVVNKAGHHLYLDGWEEFNSVILAEMEEVETRERNRQS